MNDRTSRLAGYHVDEREHSPFKQGPAINSVAAYEARANMTQEERRAMLDKFAGRIHSEEMRGWPIGWAPASQAD